MALDVWLNGISELPYLEIAERMHHVAAFEYDDGYFGHLSQYWNRLGDEFGHIDPWDTLAFDGLGLDALIECLTEARIDAAARPEAWSVHVGTLMSDPPVPLYAVLQKNALLGLIDRLLDAAGGARVSGKQLLFFGD